MDRGPHLLPGGPGMSLVELGLADLALRVLEEGARQVSSSSHVTSMANQYIVLAMHLYDRKATEVAAKVLLLSTGFIHFHWAIVSWAPSPSRRMTTTGSRVLRTVVTVGRYTGDRPSQLGAGHGQIPQPAGQGFVPSSESR